MGTCYKTPQLHQDELGNNNNNIRFFYLKTLFTKQCHVKTSPLFFRFQVTISSLKITLNRSHDGAVIKCSSLSQTLDAQSKTLLSTPIHLDVAAAPTYATMEMRGGFWQEGVLREDQDVKQVPWIVMNASIITIECIRWNKRTVNGNGHFMSICTCYTLILCMQYPSNM